MYEEDSPLYYGTYTDNFVIRWGYQSIAHRVYDMWKKWKTSPEGVTFKAADVKPGDILFVRNIDWFFKNMLDTIESPFILVTAGDAGQRVVKQFLKYASNEKILRWFAIHPYVQGHPKITPIPLGILQSPKYYHQRKEYTKLFAKLRNTTHKKNLVYMNFKKGRGGRNPVYDFFKDKPYCVEANVKRFTSYLKDMAESKFVLSPRGKAIDCYRTWEALLVGSIPIVKASQMDPVLRDLPVLIINKWEDITQEYLEQKYLEITSKKYNIEKLFLEYWTDKIYAVRNAFLEKTT